jgi:hypothetical protein
MDWRLGHPQKYVLISHLLTFLIPSKDIVPIDSIVIQSIFGQHAKKSSRHTHNVQQLSPDISLDPGTRFQIYTVFENKKTQFDLDNPSVYFQTSSEIAKDIYNGVTMIKSLGDGSYNTLLW